MSLSLYYLLDPRPEWESLAIRYVGYSANPRKRYSAHLRRRDKETHKSRWIDVLERCGITPPLKIVAIVETPDEAKRLEVEMIDILRKRGHDLTNSTDGGEGAYGTRHTAEWKAERSASQREIMSRVGVRENLRTVFKDKPLSEVHRDRISMALTGIQLTAAHCAKISAALKGRKLPDYVCSKMSASQKKRQQAIRESLSGDATHKPCSGLRK